MQTKTRRRRAVPGFSIGEPRQIRALASPIRQDILDVVTAVGPCSVAELSETLGRPADGLYYHLRLLLKVGLLVEASSDGNPMRFDAAGKDMYLKYDPGDGANRRAVLRAIGSALRRTQRGFRAAYDPDVAVVTGPQRNLWAGRMLGALSKRELAEVNRLLRQLIGVMQAGRRERSRGGTERVMHELTFVLAPSPRP